MLPLGQYFQLGYICRNVEAASAKLGRCYGIKNMRFREHAMMAQAHFYVGDILFELIEPRVGAPQIYQDYLPPAEDGIRLQHQGYMVETQAEWDAIVQKIDALGISTELRGSILNGDLHYIYANTVKEFGHYTEYVFLKGEQRHKYYEDVPRN